MFLWYNLGMASESINGPVHPSDPSSIGRGPGMFDMNKNVNFAINDADADQDRSSEMEAMYANYQMSEERDKMDAESGRMMNAEFPRDIQPFLDSLRMKMDTDLEPAVDRYGNSRALSVALNRHTVFSKDHSYLTSPDELIVVKRNNRRKAGTINEDGTLGEDSVPRVGGYSLYVETRIKDIPQVEIMKSRAGDVERTRYVQVRTEEVNYGTEKERRDMARAYMDMVRQAIVVEKVYNNANTQWMMRDALELMVKTISGKDIVKSNTDIGVFFGAERIGEIGTSKEGEKAIGRERDKATRLLELVGLCETKEKLEEVLNGTFILETILDAKTQKRVIGFMKEKGVITGDQIVALEKETPGPGNQNEVVGVYKKIVEFLIGKDITITTDANGIYTYTLGDKWLTAEQRDPSKNIPLPATYEPKLFKEDGTTRKTDAEIQKERKSKKGKNGVKTEGDVRGWLTKGGNVYIGKRDEMTAMLNKISIIVGSSLSTTEAFRNFYAWGECDWLAAEVYAPGSIPDGATVAEMKSKLKGSQEWLNWAKDVSSYFQKGGSPNGTDLGKIMWPDLWRLSDMLAKQGRPTGQYVTVGGMPNLAQGFMGLVRSEVYLNGKERIRTVREQMLGSKDKTLGIEPPKMLGDIEWAKVGGPTEVLNELFTERIGEIKWDKVELPEQVKQIATEYKTGSKAKLIEQVDKLTNASPDGIGAGAESFYWLMNFLVADDNEVKRMWAALNADLKPDTMLVTSGFTGKVKFMDITCGAQGSYDGYRAVERRAIENKVSFEDQLSKETNERSKNYLRQWYKGVKGDPNYGTWALKPVKLMNPGGGTEIEMNMGEYVDKLAVMYDFMDSAEERRALNLVPRLKVIK